MRTRSSPKAIIFHFLLLATCAMAVAPDEHPEDRQVEAQGTLLPASKRLPGLDAIDSSGHLLHVRAGSRRQLLNRRLLSSSGLPLPRRYRSFLLYPSQALVGPTTESISNISKPACVSLCSPQPTCVAFEWYRVTATCVFKSAIQGSFVSRESDVYAKNAVNIPEAVTCFTSPVGVQGIPRTTIPGEDLGAIMGTVEECVTHCQKLCICKAFVQTRRGVCLFKSATGPTRRSRGRTLYIMPGFPTPRGPDPGTSGQAPSPAIAGPAPEPAVDGGGGDNGTNITATPKGPLGGMGVDVGDGNSWSMSQVLEFGLRHNITRYKLYHFDDALIHAFRGANVHVEAGIQNWWLQGFATDPAVAREFVSQVLLPNPHVSSVAVGNEAFASWSLGIRKFVKPAYERIWAEVKNQMEPNRYPKIVVPLDFASPFAKDFETDFPPIAELLRETKSPFVANPYPYIACKAERRIPLEFCLGTNYNPNSVEPTTMLGAQIHEAQKVLAKIGYSDLPFVVGETGWPTREDVPFSTAANAETFLLTTMEYARHNNVVVYFFQVQDGHGDSNGLVDEAGQPKFDIPLFF